MVFRISGNLPEKAGSAGKLLGRYMRPDDGGRTVDVSFEEDLRRAGDGYRIDAGENRIRVYAGTAVGFNSGAGYLLRHQCDRVESREVSFHSDFRAVYFAAHFFNYYQEAPEEEICEYLESLALWGQNALCVWFDMHHFRSAGEDRAQKMIGRIRRMFLKARELGFKTSLQHISNEYYKGAPAGILARNSTESGRYFSKPGGFYGTELCPSKAEGEKLLLRSFDELLTCFGDPGIDYVVFWPYDQGGCTCDECFPWGGNGFLGISEKKAEIARRHFPNVEIVLSCWRFDAFTTGEWDAALSAVKNDGDWIDYLMVDMDAPLPRGLTETGKPVLTFPEISMAYAVPWGGFGCNPYPSSLSRQFRRSAPLSRGGALYSEGIFEDINKVVSLELMRDAFLDPAQIVREYCSYHFSPAYADEMTGIIMRMETTLPRKTLIGGEISGGYPSEKPKELYTYVIENEREVEAIARDMLSIDRHIPDDVRKSWRYRQIYLRAVGDLELLKNKGVPNSATDEIYSELTDIYHAKNAYYFVSPITRSSIMENRGGGSGI